jgi:hypothetical protein
VVRAASSSPEDEPLSRVHSNSTSTMSAAAAVPKSSATSWSRGKLGRIEA